MSKTHNILYFYYNIYIKKLNIKYNKILIKHNQAVGDADGTLHILELPYSLQKKIGDEESTMKTFWNREVERVKYYSKRFEIRDQQAVEEVE